MLVCRDTLNLGSRTMAHCGVRSQNHILQGSLPKKQCQALPPIWSAYVFLLSRIGTNGSACVGLVLAVHAMHLRIHLHTPYSDVELHQTA